MRAAEGTDPAEVYERYMGVSVADPWTRVLLEYARPQAGQHVLDVACGTGSVARQVAPIVGQAGRVVASDISNAMLSVARALPAPAGAEIDWRQGDALALDLPDASFDLVLCQQGLQFFRDRAAALREMRRVLKSDGRLGLSVWQALQQHPLFEAMFLATARHLHVPVSTVDTSFSLSDAQELRALLIGAGFERIQIVSRSMDVHLPSPEQFVQFTVSAAATSVPVFSELKPSERSALVDAVALEVAPIVQRYRTGSMLSFPMSSHIAAAC